jgi:tetratricopeptide (TPR) repeat protein
VAFSPDGQYLATASEDNTARISQVRTGKEVARINHEDRVYAVAFSPDGQYLATASEDNTARISQVKTGKEIAISRDNPLHAVAFSPDGQYLATASEDNTARISDVIIGDEVARISHEDWVYAMVFSPDGELVATASYDNTVAVHWREPQPLVKEACQRLSRNLTASEWQTYIGELDEYRQICSNRPIHPSVFKEAKKLASQRQKKEALAIIRRAKSIDPDTDLNPYSEAIDQDPKTVLQQFSALAKVEEGVKLAQEGKIKEAIASYTQAQKLDPTLEISANSWNSLCWLGSLHQKATQVMNACEKAVNLKPEDGGIRDSRGLARALTGDTAGAIEDFQAFIEWINNDNDKAKRQRWINELRAGKNPFTPEELERLLNE